MLYTDNINEVKVFPVVFENINRNMVVANNINELYERKPADDTKFWYLDFLIAAALDAQRLKEWKISTTDTIQKVYRILMNGETQFNTRNNFEERCKLSAALLSVTITKD